MEAREIAFILMTCAAITSLAFAHYTLNEQRVFIAPHTFKMDKYTVTMIDTCEFSKINGTVSIIANGTDQCDGWTDNRNNIYIMQNLSMARIKTVCNHEVMHNIIHGMNLTREEEIVSEVDEYLNFSACNWD